MTGRLDAYRSKRDPARTPEPFGGARGDRPVFVVQRHAARRLHLDFRVERDGVLASWAVPKGMPLEPGEKALAVRVEDHPLGYASFEGEIPPGRYGAGTVEIWDRGTYDLLEERPDGRLTVRLAGGRLRGVWTLVPARLGGKRENWLLIRRTDEAPAGYRPMLATLVSELPRAGEWLYEVKLDGYRALAYVFGGDCRLRSRGGNDLTPRFVRVAEAIARATADGGAVIDGELCALDERGRPSFSALQQGHGSGGLVFYAFDLLEAGGEALVELPLEERRARLRRLLRRRSRFVRVSECFDDGEALLAAAAEQGVEGIMAKRLGSRYVQGRRTRDWLKLKTRGRQEFVVAGYTRGSGSRAGTFGSLVLAVEEGGELRHVGNVGTGFDERELRRLVALLRALERPDPPFRERPRLPRVRRGDVHWVEPRLVVEVEFGEWTREGRVRHPVYKGLRDDKPAADVRHERPAEEVIRRGRRELRLSSLDKVFWPAEGIPKGDLVDYYRRVAPVLVPHLRNRPFTMRRYPDGVTGKAFFQQDAPPHMPEWIRRHRRGRAELPLVDDELALLWMANMGCIDMNPWTSRADRPERPDYVVFDLDPTPEAPWSQTVEVALLLGELLDGLGLASFPKTSGGRGLHILVPLDRRSTHDEARSFAELLAGTVVRAHPELATTQRPKARRRGVLIDAGQNGEGKTVASVYSVRPRPGAPVSTPLTWDEVGASLDPAACTMGAVLDRVARRGDLFGGVLSTRQSLSAALRRVS